MQVLAIVGSYRKGGNTDIIIEKALEGARAKGAQTEKLFVDDLNISSCRGCMEECRPEGICNIEDGLNALVAKIAAADGLIIGTPIYGNYMTGQLKIIFDRLMYVLNKTEYIKDKRNTISRLTNKKRNLLTVITAGAPNKDCADDVLKLSRRMLSTLPNAGFMKEIIATNINDKGQVAWDEERLVTAARRLGKPDAEGVAKELKAANDSVLQEAYEIGSELID